MSQDASAKVSILDPSVTFRPERKEELFRNYTSDNEYHGRVRATYYTMHTNQTVESSKERLAHWSKFNHAEMTIMEAVGELNKILDESDPDVNVPNYMHAFQTAERIRKVHPDLDWFHLTGFIHDVGKIMSVFGEPQWAVVGDTYPLGCRFSDNIVFGRESFRKNPDFEHSVYSTKFGQYQENCGLDNVTMSYGHDEYLYHVLRNHKTTLPEEGMYMIRYHSFYPWHTSEDYMHLCDNRDIEMLPWIKRFNRFDLYSKADETPDAEALKTYYQGLIDKYMPGKIKW